MPNPVVLAKAKRAYEWGRARRAMLGALPLALLVMPALALTPRVTPTIILATTLGLGLFLLLWLGHGYPRAALLGLAAGALPLGLVLCSARLGHACAGPMCMQFCFGTSALGGAAAGALIGSWAFEKRVSLLRVVTASSFGILTGAMGTTCVGLTGAAALTVGFALGIAVQWIRSEVTA